MHQQHRLTMKNIRQRKTDPSPSSRGSSLYPQDEMMSIVIEPDDTSAIMDKRGNDHAASLPADYHDDDHMQFPYHYIPQPSRMITDKRYKDFIEGRVSKRKQESMFPTGPECAGHCIAFSWIAVMFLVSSILSLCSFGFWVCAIKIERECVPCICTSSVLLFSL